MSVEDFPDRLDVFQLRVGGVRVRRIHHDAGDDSRSKGHDDPGADDGALGAVRNAVSQKIEAGDRNCYVNKNIRR